MTWSQVETDWDRYASKVLNQWRKLTAEDLNHVGGARAALIDCIELRYGVARAEADRQVEAWLQEVG